MRSIIGSEARRHQSACTICAQSCGAVEAMVARAEAELGPVTILVNNAGVSWQGIFGKGRSAGLKLRPCVIESGSQNLYFLREENPAGKSLDKVIHRGSTEWVAQAAAEQPAILDTLAYTDLTTEKPGLSLPLEARRVHSMQQFPKSR
jgi:hypothetical protein